METILVAVISAVAVLLASLIPQLIASTNRKRDQDYKSTLTNTLKLLDQIKAFYELEGMYSEELATAQGKNKEGIRREFRNRLAEKLSEQEISIDTDLTSPAKVNSAIKRYTEKLG